MSMMRESEYSNRPSNYSKNLQGFGGYMENQMHLNDRDKKKEKKRRETN